MFQSIVAHARHGWHLFVDKVIENGRCCDVVSEHWIVIVRRLAWPYRYRLEPPANYPKMIMFRETILGVPPIPISPLRLVTWLALAACVIFGGIEIQQMVGNGWRPMNFDDPFHNDLYGCEIRLRMIHSRASDGQDDVVRTCPW